MGIWSPTTVVLFWGALPATRPGAIPDIHPRLAIETFLLPRIVVALALATEVSQYLGISIFFTPKKKGAQTPCTPWKLLVYKSVTFIFRSWL